MAPPTLTCARGQIPGVALYYVITAQEAVDAGDLWAGAGGLASRLAAEHLGDADAFTLVFNGATTRRRPWPHVHVFLAATRAARRWALLCYFLKHLTRWWTWPLFRRIAAAPRSAGC